jgi:SAM-dependent methyltransferase
MTEITRSRYFSTRLISTIMAVSLLATIETSAFLAPQYIGHGRSSSLHAMVPPMIIGPMIKKMREKNKKKETTPLINPTEAADEAPGLRVGKGAWKWPAVWPYDRDFFLPAAEADAKARKQNLDNVASMISGVATGPASSEEKESDADRFDPMKYWGVEQASSGRLLDDEAIEKLKAHFEYYLEDGVSVLEFGPGEDSYLPDSIKPSRHVGVGANLKAMDMNPSLSERLVVDLNKVIPERDVDSDDLRRLASDPYDCILMTNTVEYLTNPREVFRSAWYLLKPGGIMMVAFSGKTVTQNMFTDAQTRIWRDYNDDQHMWITGSFFQFSAGDGWESLAGFDISPESAKALDTGGSPLSGMFKQGKDNNLFVVQAYKAAQDDSIDPFDPERSIKSLTWMLPKMEFRDKNLVVPRLAKAYQTAKCDSVRSAIEKNIEVLPKIYEALIKMDQFAFTFGMQAQMAADLCSDPDFTASDEQMLALKQGLGLRTPSPEFWAPVGADTAAMGVEEKISLLAYIVPRIGSGNKLQDDALHAFVTALRPTYAVIRSKCPELSETDVQLLGTELLAAEVLPAGRSSRKEFAAWLAALSSDELRGILSVRKLLPQEAKEELAAFKQAKQDEAKRIEDYKQKLEEQKESARQNRSMIFNPRTEKMELFENPNKK